MHVEDDDDWAKLNKNTRQNGKNTKNPRLFYHYVYELFQVVCFHAVKDSTGNKSETKDTDDSSDCRKFFLHIYDVVDWGNPLH